MYEQKSTISREILLRVDDRCASIGCKHKPQCEPERTKISAVCVGIDIPLLTPSCVELLCEIYVYNVEISFSVRFCYIQISITERVLNLPGEKYSSRGFPSQFI